MNQSVMVTDSPHELLCHIHQLLSVRLNYWVESLVCTFKV